MLPYHETRFTYDARRRVLWQALYEGYFHKLIREDDHFLELGAGYCDFINSVKCAQRTAVDQFPMLAQFVEPGVRPVVGKVTDLEFLPDSSINFAFASNLFEHLTQQDFSEVLRQLRRKLQPGGTLNIIQPNYRRAFKEYFDDYTHVSVYSHISLCDFLSANGFSVFECRPGFLPFSIKSHFPVSPLLIRLYLLSPWKPLAKQMLIRARPTPE
jgi:ubiquinone/menaquinone biosynthesis C-methylase UbiE